MSTLLISTCKNNSPGPRHHKFIYTALDNGAFSCLKNGKKFNDYIFLRNVEKINKQNLKPLFIVCPDIVAGGLKSLDFSLSWIDKINYNKIALVVQDGMKTNDIKPIINKFQYIFVGGSVKWKWATVEQWVKFSHKNNKPCHIGQCGQFWMLEAAKRIGANSVDSTSWQVNNSWSIIERFKKDRQLKLNF